MNLNKILKIKYPFIQGGMANISNGEFAAAVSNSGGLGVIGTGGMTPKEIVENIKICKSKTNKPFGVNIIMLHKNIDEIAKILIKEKVDVITTGAGNPEKYIKMWKDNNIKVFPVISSLQVAKRMEKIGATGIIAEGSEAGGHIGETSTMVLTLQIANNVKIPVISAGGIATGKQILAAEVLGASGVQMGTLMLASKECPIHKNYKEKIISAKTSQVTVIGRINGIPTRVLKNKMSRKYKEMEKNNVNLETLELFTLGALKKSAIKGDLENGSIMAGEIVGEVKEVLPVKEIFEKLNYEYLLERKKYENNFKK